MTVGALDHVEVRPLSTALTASVAVGATVLPVDFAVDFPDSGGSLLLNGATYTFTTATETTITLAAPLDVAASTDDVVQLANGDGSGAVSWVAWVALGDGDPVPALIPTPLIPYFPEGFADVGRMVEAELSGGSYRVVHRPDTQPTFDAAVRVSDPNAEGGQAGGIDSSGAVNASALSYSDRFDAAAASMFVDGVPLVDVLGMFAQGKVAQGSRVPAVTGIGGGEYAVLQMDFYLSAPRAVSVSARYGVISAQVDVPMAARLRMEYSATAPVSATVTSVQIGTWQGTTGVANRAISFTPNIGADWDTGYYSLRLSLVAFGTGNTLDTTAAEVVLTIRDDGPIRATENVAYKPPSPGTLATGGSDTGSTAAPQAKSYTLTYGATATRWYYGDDTQQGAGEFQRFGFISGGPGNRRSAVWFDDAKIRADLVGGAVTKVEAYLYCFDRDPIIAVGFHGDSTPASNWGSIAGRVLDVSRFTFTEGQDRWVDVTSAAADWKTGTKRGLLIGPGPSNDTKFSGGYYGMGKTAHPKLRLTFTR